MTENWITTASAPFYGLKYQTMQADGREVARVTENGREVVSPSADLESVWAQFQSRHRIAVRKDETAV